MGNDQYQGPDDEQEEAKRRIEEIRSGGATPPARGADEYDEFESDAVARARGRADAARARLGVGGRAQEPPPASRVRAPGRPTGGAVARRALLMIGGIVGVGVLIVLLIIALAGGLGGGPSIFNPATATPTATSTPTPTPTPTPMAPPLSYPVLPCLDNTTQGDCANYCRIPANSNVCNPARDLVEGQGADWLTFLQCISGPTMGEPRTCMEEAWYVRQPWYTPQAPTSQSSLSTTATPSAP